MHIEKTLILELARSCNGDEMKKTIMICTIILCIVVLGYSQNPSSSETPESCSIFTASLGDTVLFGNNEDYTNPKTYYWISPSTSEFYGGVYLGYDNMSPQGGINEKGLAFDYNALPKASLNPHPELPSLYGNPGFIILRECSTVEEAIDMAKRYSWGTSLAYQMHMADSTGDAVVIGAGPDGELAFTRKEKGDGFLVSTNFNLSHHRSKEGLCSRYDTAVEMLQKINDDSLTIEYFRSILNAVHAEGASSNTLYSNIFDLKKGTIYLYYWHQFDEVAILTVEEELTKKTSTITSPTAIKDLFSQETLEKAAREFEGYTKRTEDEAGTGSLMVILGFFILLYLRRINTL